MWRSCDASVDPRSRHAQNHALRFSSAKSHEHGVRKSGLIQTALRDALLSQNAERGGVAATALEPAQGCFWDYQRHTRV
jgi:hypothetical protein